MYWYNCNSSSMYYLVQVLLLIAESNSSIFCHVLTGWQLYAAGNTFSNVFGNIYAYVLLYSALVCSVPSLHIGGRNTVRSSEMYCINTCTKQIIETVSAAQNWTRSLSTSWSRDLRSIPFREIWRKGHSRRMAQLIAAEPPAFLGQNLWLRDLHSVFIVLQILLGDRKSVV